jgi:PAS domain S-box-containing protein
MSDGHPTGPALDAALAEALLRTSGALTLVLAPDGTVLRWGEACERVTGWSAAERVGRPFWELLLPEEREPTRGVFERMLGNGEDADACHYENVWLARGGERRLVAWSGTAVRGPDGTVSAVLATGLDVTERARAEDALRRQARRLEALAEAARVFASGLDYKTTLDTVARRLAELIGDGALIRVLSGDGTWLVPVAVWHPSPERAALRRRLLASAPQRTTEGITAGVIAGRRTLRIPEVTREFVRNEMKPEYWPYLEGVTSLLIAPLEHRRQVFGHITLMRDQGGVPYTREDETLLEDLAQRAAQAIENARLYGEAQAAIAARDEFLSIASHELRTPLTALRLALENMRRVATREALERLPPAHVERVLGTAERQGQRLEKLVAALLDVSRIHMGRLELEVEDVELGAAVTEAVAGVEEEAAQNGSTIVVSGAPVQGLWDRLRVSQVATNLLSNAVKYGAGRPVHVRYGPEADQAILEVRDHGIGIDPADQLQIFERFERAVSSRNYGGLGLGLFIVKRIVEAHGGTISVESRPGEGATFRVELPLRPAVAIRPARGGDHAAH